MELSNEQLAATVAENAQSLWSRFEKEGFPSDEELFDTLVSRWQDANEADSQLRPSKEGVQRFLNSVIEAIKKTGGNLKKGLEKNKDVALVTLTMATIHYLTNEASLNIPPEYTIPLTILAVIIYRAILSNLDGPENKD